MKLLILGLVVLTLAIVRAVGADGELGAISEIEPPTPCNRADCQPKCADSVYSPDTCCPSCENSTCRFRGCVHYGAFGPQWRPDPCTICSCYNRQEFCTEILCDKPECFGYPQKTKDGSCCPVCDFGIAEDECAPIPVRKQAMYVAMGDDSCHSEVEMHECDKQYVYKGGHMLKCVPKNGNISHKFDNECSVRRVVYRDVRRCEMEEPEPREIPADLDLNSDDCQFYVEP